jgi:DNA polymerase-4
MTTTLLACVAVPHLLVQLATTQLAIAPPVAVVAHDAPHAPVLDCCAQAITYGVAIGMAAGAAQQHCAPLQVVTLAPSILATAHATIDAVLCTFGDIVTQHTRSRWLLEVRALGTHYAHADALAAQIQQAIATLSGLHTAIGLAPTTIVAQVAARAAHHHGSWRQIVLPGDEAAFLAPLPVRYLPHVGDKTCARLAQFGISTIGQLAALPATTVTQLLGPRGTMLHQEAQGRNVARGRQIHDVFESQWAYGSAPCADPQQLHAHIHRLSERVGRQLRAQGLTAGNVTVTVRWADGRSQQRKERLHPRVDLDSDLAQGARAALTQLLQQRRLAVRDLTVRLGDTGPHQQTLFQADPRQALRQRALDRIKRRHGTSAILFAWMLKPPSAP